MSELNLGLSQRVLNAEIFQEAADVLCDSFSEHNNDLCKRSMEIDFSCFMHFISFLFSHTFAEISLCSGKRCRRKVENFPSI